MMITCWHGQKVDSRCEVNAIRPVVKKIFFVGPARHETAEGDCASSKMPSTADSRKSTLFIVISAVMLCLNEDGTLGLCIEKAKQAFSEMGLAGEAVVADNCSADRSIEVAEALGARVVHDCREGYGTALLVSGPPVIGEFAFGIHFRALACWFMVLGAYVGSFGFLECLQARWSM